MQGYVEEFIFYGDDIKIGRFPADTKLLYANPPIEELPDPDGTIARTLDEPLGALPLEKQLTSKSRVTIAFDDPVLPIPLMLRDTRGMVMEELLRRLFKIGIPKDRISLICANGLHRKWTIKELSLILGKKVVSEMGSRITCHDATKENELTFLGTTENGYEVEVNKAAIESDITIYVNMNYTTMNGGWKSILVGLGSWRSIRHHHTYRQWNAEHTIMDPHTSPMHSILREMGTVLKKSCNIFQIETVTNNKVWPFPIDHILQPIQNGGRNGPPGAPVRTLLSLASLSPQPLKRWVRNTLIRSDYRLCGVFAGDVELVHEKTIDLLFRQQNVKADGQTDVLIFGVPNLMPYSAQSVFNPILLRSLVMGYLLGLFRNRPLVKKGGVIVAYNPGIEKFHSGHHPSYIDFWNNDLENHSDPVESWDTLAEPYATNPRYLRLYQDAYAYHGTHSLINWMWSGMGLKQVKAVILAGAKEPETARKIGFIPAPDLDTAISMAREMTGEASQLAYQVIPPLFCVDLG